ncbi:TPA: hypothetical protein ACG6EJ_005257, partial [Escherichia coli]
TKGCLIANFATVPPLAGMGTVSFTTNPISSGSKISDLERRSRSRLASVVFPAPKGPLIQIIIVDGL